MKNQHDVDVSKIGTRDIITVNGKKNVPVFDTYSQSTNRVSIWSDEFDCELFVSDNDITAHHPKEPEVGIWCDAGPGGGQIMRAPSPGFDKDAEVVCTFDDFKSGNRLDPIVVKQNEDKAKELGEVYRLLNEINRNCDLFHAGMLAKDAINKLADYGDPKRVKTAYAAQDACERIVKLSGVCGYSLVDAKDIARKALGK